MRTNAATVRTGERVASRSQASAVVRAWRVLVKDVRRNRYIYLMLTPVMAYYLLFHYGPMYGVQIAFRDYSIAKGISRSPWIGWENFTAFFKGFYFTRLVRNTLLINLLDLALGFPAPLILALLLNEIRSRTFKRTVQTVSYMPHFVSLVVVVGMLIDFLARDGLINNLLGALASVSEPTPLMQYRGLLLRPLGFTLEAYRRVFLNPMILRGYRNTLVYAGVGTAINLLMTCLGAYGLSRRNVLLKNPFMFVIVFTMFFSGGLVLTYLLVANTLDLVDKPWAIILPGAINTWNLIIMRTAFQSIPDAFEEAARIDGANDLTILFRIILPLSMPVVAVMILFYSVAHWNSWFPAMIYLRTRELYPLQLILREILVVSSLETMTAGIASGDVEPIGETIKYATILSSPSVDNSRRPWYYYCANKRPHAARLNTEPDRRRLGRRPGPHPPSSPGRPGSGRCGLRRPGRCAMIVGYDAPNHALLLHFCRHERPAVPKLDMWEASYTPSQLTRVEMAFDAETRALLAILFYPRSFFVPSFGSREDLLSRWRFRHSATEVRVDLGVVPQVHDPVWVRPGIQLFLSLPQRTGRPRPFLHGLRILTSAQALELDLEAIDIRVAPNSLGGVRADEFVAVGSGQ